MQAPPTAEPYRWPIAATLQTRSTDHPFTTPVRGARLVNAYAEVDKIARSYQVYKRFGIAPAAAYSTVGSLYGIGAYTSSAFGGVVLAVARTTPLGSAGVANFYRLTSSSAIVQAVDESAPYFFESIRSNPRTVIFGNGVKAYVTELLTNTVTQVTDGDFPGTFVPGFVTLNGRVYVMDQQGNIFGATNLDDGLTWSALNVIRASSESDLGVALFKHLHYIVAMKQYTTQVFYDAGNAPPGSPLSPVNDAQLPLGCLSGRSAQSIDNILIWATANKTASPQIVLLEQLSPRVVSTPDVDRILAKIWWGEDTFTQAPPSGIFSWVIKRAGHRLYGLSAAKYGITLVYDIDQDLWYFWTGTAAGSWWPVTAIAYDLAVATTAAKQYVQTYNGGGLYEIDDAKVYPNDMGVVLPMDIYTTLFDGDINRSKTLTDMRFNADRTQGKLLSRFTDDDFENWSHFRSVDMNQKKPRLINNGTFDRRAYHFRWDNNSDLRLRGVDLQMDIGVL